MRRARARGRLALATALAGGLLLAGAGAAPAAASGGPSISAPAAIVVDSASGAVLFARDAREPRPIASTTKLMTALLVLERVSLDDEFTAGAYDGISAESTLGLHAGERMRVADLLRALLLASANDAAQTLAQGTAGSTASFVAMMNRRARALGLRHTHYANPIGLDDPANYSSAADLVELTARLRRIPFFAATVAMPRARLASGSEPRVVDNRNDLVGRQPRVNGVKTGHTLGAGYVLVGSASRRGVTVISAVLGDPSEAARDSDTVALLDYGLDQFRTVTILRPGRRVASAAVRDRGSQRVALEPVAAVRRTLRRGQRASVSVRAPRELEGPLAPGARAGVASVRVGGRLVAKVALVTAAAVPAPPLARRALDALLRPSTLALLVLAAAGAAVALGTGARRRRVRDAATKAPSA